MDKIYRKSLGVVLFIKANVNCVLLRRKNTPPLWIDKFAPSSCKHRLVRTSFEFQRKVDTVWNYQVKSKKLKTSWHRLF